MNDFKNFKNVIKYFSSNELMKAEIELRKLFDFSPQDPNIYNLEGLVFYKSGNPAGAIGMINRAIELSPDTPAFYYNKGLCYLEINDIENAKLFLNKAIEVDKNYKPAYEIIETINKM